MFKRAWIISLVFTTTSASAQLAPAAAKADETKELTPLVLVSAGPYQRGFDGILDSEKHIITLSAYQIESDEVTNRQYNQCVAAKVCKKPKWGGEPIWPVRGVSWYDADDYCKWAGRRLPTTAEWEKAAFPAFPGQDGRGPRIGRNTDLCNILNIAGYPKYLGTSEPLLTCRQRSNRPWPVSRLEEMIIGNDKDVSIVDGRHNVWDLFGNVAEWVSDWADNGSDYFHPPTLVDPKGPKGPDVIEEKVIRGGSFLSKEGIDESHWRAESPTERFKDVGFRCAADVKSADSQK